MWPSDYIYCTVHESYESWVESNLCTPDVLYFIQNQFCDLANKIGTVNTEAILFALWGVQHKTGSRLSQQPKADYLFLEALMPVIMGYIC